MNLTSLLALTGRIPTSQNTVMQETAKTQAVYVETSGVPGRAWGRITVTQLAGGVLKSLATRETKGLPRTGMQPLLYRWYITYTVT